MKTTDNQNIKLVADVTLLHKDKVLLVTYKDTNIYDHQKGWFLPDDLIKFNEQPEDAARRILNSQCGYMTANLTLGHMESFVGNDGSWHLIFHYFQKLEALPKIFPSGNIDKYEWFNFYSLPDEKEIAHRGWAKYTIERILTHIK